MKNRSQFCLTMFSAFAVVLVMLAGGSVLGQTRKVTVQARGSIETKPDQLVFSVSLTKYAKTAKEAKEAFDELKKEFLSAFNVMKFKGLSMKSTSRILPTAMQPEFGGPMMGGGGMAPPIAFGGGGGFGGGAPPVPAEQQYYSSETFQMTVDGIDKLGTEAIEAQIASYNKELKRLKLSAAGGFSTRLKSQAPFMKKAFAKAVAEARNKAEALATLSDSKVGKVLEVMESSAFVQPDFPYGMNGMASVAYNPGITGVGISSTQTVVASLRVTFELTD